MPNDNIKDLTAEAVMEKHPDIFRERGLPPSSTCMCWGLEIGEGWFGHVDAVCTLLDEFARRTGVHVVAHQVKQKFGELRFYYSIDFPEGMDDVQRNYLSNRVEGMIEFMETLCAFTCERCGDIGTTRGSVGWINCFCKSCREKRQK